MPGKMTKSILRPPFRPPRYRQPSAARVYLAGRSEKRKIFTSARESSGESRLITIAEQTRDVAVIAAQEKTHPIVQIFEQQITNFSKYKLAKAFVQWSRDHTANDLTNTERDQWSTLISI